MLETTAGSSFAKSFSMSASLETLPSECISSLVEWLHIDDFISLMSIGSRALRCKLRNAEDFCFKVAHGTKMPYAVLGLSKLRSLAIYGLKEPLTMLDFRDKGELQLVQGSKTLKKLVLSFRNAPSLLWSPYAELTTLPIRSRFPALSTLVLRNISCDNNLESLFGELPDTLTTFELYFADWFELDGISMSSIAKLPRYLTTLELFARAIVDPSDPDFDFSSVLPPNLTYLRLVTLASPSVLNYCPSTLLKLFVSVSFECDFVWQSSKLPPNLISLSISGFEGLRMEWDKPLPSALEIDFNLSSRLYEGLTISSLPRRMRNIPELLINKEFDHLSPEALVTALNDLHKKFPNLRNTRIFAEDNLKDLPSCVETLKIEGETTIDSPVPSSLASLFLFAPMSSSCLENIPNTLLRLFVNFKREGGRPFHLAFPHSGYQPWNETDLAQLRRFTQLTLLNIRADCITDLSSLAPLAELKSLKQLFLFDFILEDLQPVARCLPQSLIELRFFCREESAVMFDWLEEKEQDKLPFDLFSACELASVTPHLKSLKITGETQTAVALGDSIATIPRGLQELSLYFSIADLERDALCLLPPSLTSLQLELRQQLNGIITNELFCGLPDSLAELYVTLGPSAQVDEGIFDLLPKTIARFNFEVTDWALRDSLLSEEFNAEKEKFLRQNPLLHGLGSLQKNA